MGTYYFCVCVAEISAGTQFMACVQRKLCCLCCPDKEKIRQKNLRRLRSRGMIGISVNELAQKDESFAEKMSCNPMMNANNVLGKKMLAEKNAADARAADLQAELENLKVQTVIDMKR